MTELITAGIIALLISLVTSYFIILKKENRRKKLEEERNRLEESRLQKLEEKKRKEKIKYQVEQLQKRERKKKLDETNRLEEIRIHKLEEKNQKEKIKYQVEQSQIQERKNKLDETNRLEEIRIQKLEEDKANAKAERKKEWNRFKRTERERLKKLDEELIISREGLAIEEKHRQQRKKSNWNDFQQILQQNGITKLYHFTDRANLHSIRTNGGLYSWYYCQHNNITIPKPGGSEISWILDKQKGLQNYVRVSFVRDHPMLYIAQNDGRVIDPIILEIKIDLIYELETRYANQNAAKNGVSTETTFEKFKSIQFSLLKKRYLDLTAEERPFYQAEILILEKIPLECITNINSV